MSAVLPRGSNAQNETTQRHDGYQASLGFLGLLGSHRVSRRRLQLVPQLVQLSLLQPIAWCVRTGLWQEGLHYQRTLCLFSVLRSCAMSSATMGSRSRTTACGAWIAIGTVTGAGAGAGAGAGVGGVVCELRARRSMHRLVTICRMWLSLTAGCACGLS